MASSTITEPVSSRAESNAAPAPTERSAPSSSPPGRFIHFLPAATTAACIAFGVALCATTALAIAFVAHKRKLASLVFFSVTALAIVGIVAFTMFVHRVVAHHPAYGTMVIDDNLQGFFDGVCSTVTRDGQSDLLSIPFPYANYYCNIPPWQGFVQSFFDTAGRDVIDDMIAKLQHSPPRWILYQRQLENLAMHERVFNNGRRLPHRDLDDLIVANVASGQWQIVVRGQDRAGSDWLLLRTQKTTMH